MAFAGVETAGECGREFADQAVVGEAEVAEFEGEGHEVGYAGISTVSFVHPGDDGKVWRGDLQIG